MTTNCSYKSDFDSNYYCEKLNLNCVRKDQIAYFKTSKGDFDVQLYGKNNPVTVYNFIKNVQKEVYKNKRFYKIIYYPQAQLIYSGVYPENNNYTKDNSILNKLSPIIPLEIKLKKEIEPKYSYQIKDPSEVSDLTNTFEKGSLAMLKNGERNSSSTEFFFVTNKFPELDGRYAIFGKVIKGIEILEKIDQKDLIYEIKIAN